MGVMKMAGVTAILVRRAIALTLALIIIVFITGMIMEATGYSEKIWKAIINQQVRALLSSSKNIRGNMICTPLGSELVTTTTNYEKVGENVYRSKIMVDIGAKSLNYNSTQYPPGLPIVVINNLKACSNNTRILITVFLVRPDNIKITLYNKTITLLSMSNNTMIIKPDKNFVLNEVKKIFGLKEVNGINVESIVYGSVVVSGGNITVKPLKGEYSILVNLKYLSSCTPSKPFDSITVRISPPLKCIPLSQYVANYRAYLEKLYGLDKPWYDRVIPLVLRTLTFNLGETRWDTVTNVAGLSAPAPVSAVILACLPRTIVMLTVAEIICFLIAIPLAPKIAYRYGTLMDRLIVSYAALFNAIPVWWLGMVFILLFAYLIPIFPAQSTPIIKYINNFFSDPLYNLVMIMYYAALPIITIVITFLGTWLYSVRAVVLRIVREDYVMVAKAKGLPEKDIIRKYIVRVAAAPIVTYIILALAGSLGGMIITESVFNYPGMGTLYYMAINAGDVATILGLTYVLTLVYIVARFILEVLYIYLDPRVRY